MENKKSGFSIIVGKSGEINYSIDQLGRTVFSDNRLKKGKIEIYNNKKDLSKPSSTIDGGAAEKIYQNLE